MLLVNIVSPYHKCFTNCTSIFMFNCPIRPNEKIHECNPHGHKIFQRRLQSPAMFSVPPMCTGHKLSYKIKAPRRRQARELVKMTDEKPQWVRR